MIRSYVKIKPIKDDGAFGSNFNEVRKGINRTGSVTENIGNNLVETHKLIQFEKDWLRDKQDKEVDDDKDDEKESLQGFKRWFKGFRDMFRLQKRDESTKDKELEKIEEEGGNFGQKTKEKVKSGLELLGGFLTPIFKWVVTMGVLKWMSDPENAKKAEKVFKLIGAIAKFAWKIGKFGVGLIMAGLTKVFGVFDGSTSPIKKGFKFVFGALQLFAGFKTLQYLLNPLKAVSDAKKLTTLFNSNAEKEVEFKKNEQWRKFGYKDKETGAIYTEKEYKAQKKSVERQQKKLRKQGRDAQAKQLGAKFNSRVKNPTRLQQGKNVGKKLLKPGMQKGIAVVGGISRIASGIAMGEDKTQAVGAGIGQAAGGMIGAAAGTALLGPFLGPFAPIVGNAIGSFLGEWVGKTFLPMIKPLFEPIQKAFQMWWTIIKGVADETGITEFLGTFFKFLGQIGKVMFDILGWIMKPLTWLLGGAIKVIGKSISFIISAAKNIFAFMVNPIGFAWKIIRGKDPGKDVKLEEMSEGGALQAAFLSGYAEGGKYTMGYRMGQITPDQYIYNFQKFTSKTVVKGGELIEESENLTELGGSIEVQDLIDHKEQLLSHPLLKSFKIADIINRKTGLPPEVLFPILMESDAQEATYKKMDAAIALDIKKMEAKFGKGKGWSWYDTSFSEGGEFRSGTLSDSQIFEMTEKRDAMHDQFKYKNQRDNDAEMMMQAPIVITKQVTTPVINTKSSGHIIPVVASPSPMFTC
tara:strand:+ start:2529 stop:4775 length:2247 start_codon:yes stop_codon:yes gene_type:complete